MTRKDAQKHAEIIKAFANGAEIETFEIITAKWVLTDSPLFLESNQYRIKEKKTLGFENAKDIISLGFVKQKSTDNLISICQVTETFVSLYNIGSVNYQLFQKSFTKIDGSPIEF